MHTGPSVSSPASTRVCSGPSRRKWWWCLNFRVGIRVRVRVMVPEEVVAVPSRVRVRVRVRVRTSVRVRVRVRGRAVPEEVLALPTTSLLIPYADSATPPKRSPDWLRSPV